MSASELAVSYATLILADEGIEITADKINSLVNAAKVPDFEAIWATLFAKALGGKDITGMLMNVGGSSSAAAAPSGGAAAGGSSGAAAATEAAAPAAEEKEEAKEESDEDMGFGLFD